MKRPFRSLSKSLTSPLEAGFEIVPSDTSDLPAATRAIYVGTSGDVRLTLLSGDTLTLRNLPVGWHPIRVRRIWATATTASALCGGW